MSAAVARKLAEAGLDAAAIVAALEAFEAVEEDRKAKSRERKRRQRERESVTERDVTGQDVTERDALSPSPPPRTPPPRPHTRGNIYTPRARASDPRAFEAFWAAYPRRKAKDVAAKAFAKAMQRIDDPDPLAVILAGIERALPGWDDLNFVPYPASWLNAGSWDDEAPTPRTGPRNDRPSPDRKYDAKLDNYHASWTGADGADQVLASRRDF